MQLIVITTPDFWPGEIQAVCALFDAGLSLLHLRKPTAAAGELAAWLNAVPESMHNRIVLHDHFELLEQFPLLRGVHLNSRNPQVPASRTAAADFQQSADSRQLQVSCSCHSFSEVSDRKPACSYVFLSPIFDSISKQGYGPTLTDAALQQARQQGIVDSHVYALGGVNLDRLEQVAEYGFGGAAVLGDLWQYRSSRVQLLAHFSRLKSVADSLSPQPPVVLSIAGSDCSGGAGIQADIKTISALSCYAASVITAVTVQNTRGVQAVNPVPAHVVAQQMDAVMSDLPVRAIKIGMVCDDAMALAVAERLAYWRSQGWHGAVVYDPVMVSTSGRRLMETSTLRVVREQLFPQCSLITPNLNEAAVLVDRPLLSLSDMEQAAVEIRQLYGCAVLVKGGHLSGCSMCDVLCISSEQSQLEHFASPKIETRNLHGTGCTLSSAIATRLALGDVLPQAVSAAKRYMNRAIEGSRLWHIGAGNGPLNHLDRCLDSYSVVSLR